LVRISDEGAGEFGVELLGIGEFNVESDSVNRIKIHVVHVFQKDLRCITALDVAIEGLGIADVHRIEVVTAVGYHGFVIDLIGLIVLENLQYFKTKIFVKERVARGYCEYQCRKQAEFCDGFHEVD
jgi:hypothetical protein